VIVVDSTAWVDLVRGRRTAVAATLERLIDERAELAVTEVIVMEVLAGATSREALADARLRLVGLPILRLEGLADFEAAARIYRTCRAAGATIRSHLDCLVAVPTIRHDASLLHNDRDFDVIARHTALKVEAIDGPRQRPDEPHVRERRGRWPRPVARRRRAPARAG
jgi:predicted nucleic acid-binding protein